MGLQGDKKGQMRQIKNRFLCLIVVLLFALSVSGYHFLQYSKLRRNEIRSAKEFFEYLKDEDIDSLVDLFSDEVQDTCDLEEEWEEFFDVIDGNIESYDRLRVTYSEQFIDDGNITRCLLEVVFLDVTTDEGEEYDRLEYYTFVVHSDRDKLGITVVSLEDDDEFLSRIGN